MALCLGVKSTLTHALVMGQAMKLRLSCYLVLLSIDSKNQVTRQPQFHDLTQILSYCPTVSFTNTYLPQIIFLPQPAVFHSLHINVVGRDLQQWLLMDTFNMVIHWGNEIYINDWYAYLLLWLIFRVFSSAHCDAYETFTQIFQGWFNVIRVMDN